jgi:protein-tyrosine phosphatase
MELVGAIKIKDGLFLGDEFAAQVRDRQDLEFVVANKVTHIINTAARQIPNHWEPIGVQYLDFYWLDHDNQQLFDGRDEIVPEFCAFIERGNTAGESVLVHSVRGQCRSVVIIVAYLMRKYKWTMVKSFEFVNSRRPDLNTRQSFIQQLAGFEGRLAKQMSLAAGWESLPPDPEEIVLRNTFLNSQFGQIAEMAVIDQSEKVNKLVWSDANSGNSLVDLDRPNLLNRVENGFVVLRSCLKGGRSLGEIRVPVKIQRERRANRLKNDLFGNPTRIAKAAENAMEFGISATTEDLDSAPKKKPSVDSLTNSSKKPRASSAGPKEQNTKPLTMKKARFGLQLGPGKLPPPEGRTVGVYSSHKTSLETGKPGARKRPATSQNEQRAKGSSKALPMRVKKAQID